MSKAAATRHTILQKAFELIYQQGFQTTSIDEILATTQVTKGAFFYHFKNKEEMGLAMIKEVLYPGMVEQLVKPLAESVHPVEDILAMMKHLLLKAPFFRAQYGCPAVNLIEEMAAGNEAFRQALSSLISECQQAIQASIRQGIAAGQIRQGVHASQVAAFVMAGYSGVRNLGKLFGATCYEGYLQELKRYLEELT